MLIAGSKQTACQPSLQLSLTYQSTVAFNYAWLAIAPHSLAKRRSYALQRSKIISESQTAAFDI